MIELGYGHQESSFESGRKWMDPSDKSFLSCLPGHSEDSQRNLITSRFFFEHFLGATCSSSGSCDGSACRCFLSTSIVRYLLQLIKEKAGCRHSLTSLLPTEMQEPTQYYIGYDFRPRKMRCHSCEPQSKGTQLGNSILAPLLFERFVQSSKHKSQCVISHQRKRLSLSDSEICYAKDSPEPVVNEPTNSEKNEPPATTSETNTVVDPPEESTKTPCFEAGLEEEMEQETMDETPTLPSPKNEKTDSTESPNEEAPKPRKKRVRFADDVGDALFEEKLIQDTCLPPILHFDSHFCRLTFNFCFMKTRILA